VGIPLRPSAAVPRRLSHGEVVVRQGDRVTRLFLVASGVVRLSSVTREGRELVVGLLGPGDVFGEAMLLGHPSPVEARVVGTTRILSLSLRDLRDLLRRHPAVSEELLRLIAARLHRTGTALEEALAADVPTRVSRRLGELAADHGVPTPEGVRLRVPLTQEELGRMIGATRETVNRTMGGLVARGLVRTRGRVVVIPDPDALASFAATSAAP
jgi:CRP-like cAMP-binding protein